MSAPAPRAPGPSSSRFRPERELPALPARSSRRSWRPGLARKHPEIKTYTGRGIDDPRGDDPRRPEPTRLPRLGALAAGRVVHRPLLPPRPEPLRRATTAATSRTTDGPFVERDAEGAELSVDHGYYHADDTVDRSTATASANAATSRSRSPTPRSTSRRARVTAHADARGPFDATFAADPDGNLDTHIVAATDGTASASESYQVVSRRRPDQRPADRRRPAHVPARADHRPGLRRLLRRPGERDRGQGRADQPRRPGLRGRPLDPAWS